MAVDTSHSTVAIHAQVIARNLDAFVDLLARMLEHADVPRGRARAPEARERGGDRRGARQRPRRRAKGDAADAVRRAPLRSSAPGGTTQSVPAITRDDVVAHYRRFVVEANIVVGHRRRRDRAERAPAIAARLVAALPEGARAADAIAEPTMRPGRRLLVVDKPERTQTQILVGDARNVAARRRPRPARRRRTPSSAGRSRRAS